MDHNFNDHFSFQDPGRKPDPNIKIKPKKKIVTKEIIRKTVAQVETLASGEVKKQEVIK